MSMILANHGRKVHLRDAIDKRIQNEIRSKSVIGAGKAVPRKCERNEKRARKHSRNGTELFKKEARAKMRSMAEGSDYVLSLTLIIQLSVFAYTLS